MTLSRVAVAVKKTSQAVTNGNAGAVVKTPKLQRLSKPASKAPASDPVEEPERGDLT